MFINKSTLVLVLAIGLLNVICGFEILAVLPKYDSAIDVSVEASNKMVSENWSCLSKLHSKAFIHLLSKDGSLNQNFGEIFTLARESGFKDIDLVLNISTQCSQALVNGKELISEIGKAIGYNNVNLWISIQNNECWDTDKKSNLQFLQDFINQIGKSYIRGIQTDGKSYQSIIGGTNNDLSDLQLWYTQNSTQPVFSDFKNFNGWALPNVKKYLFAKQLCGIEVGLDYYLGSYVVSHHHSSTTKRTSDDTGGYSGYSGTGSGTSGGTTDYPTASATLTTESTFSGCPRC
ncbi:hypothetical protein DLAC_06468 [Tieghemostelium lacteum]|uniref:Glycoside hydrolase family 25 protein n=1 Tax=Tieghemostelium lacteum TaxID=361077 RepID=A0A151ZEY2_TIELA|nr:hypothetical protein DLAC_06468 [Tieghemostelium lacteum]|eukprot:KYQ92485.1 hypothetical protein DLAC_06468 [Tieghemostelium lacteum]